MSSGHIVIVNMPQFEFLEVHYHLQHFTVNDALLRSMGSIQYVGSMDADEYLEIPSGHNILTYLLSTLQCQKTTNSSVCSSHSFAAVTFGSFLINLFTGTSAFDRDAQTIFCKNASLQDYSYLPPRAECLREYNNNQPNEVCTTLLIFVCISDYPSAFCIYFN